MLHVARESDARVAHNRLGHSSPGPVETGATFDLSLLRQGLPLRAVFITSRPPLHPLLVGLVDRLWCSLPDPSSEVRIDWILPTCRAQLILSPGSAIFVGPKVRAERVERRTGERTVGVSLAAGAEFAFTGSGGDETCGHTLPLDALVAVGSLPDRLAEQADDCVLDRLEGELVDWLTPASADSRVLKAAHAIRGGQRATKVVDVLGVDRRRFVPEFRRMVGVGPKQYERICRFNAAVEAIRQPGADPLASVAVDHGFADQAHLTREIGHFARTSPSRLHRDGATMINHLEYDKIFKT